ncbi:MAG: dienelactone hydrolase family protein [Betaproteobacteria bacterium]|nr:dienelactone hydrolase family protein [Betaproteobacteria bacterium]
MNEVIQQEIDSLLPRNELTRREFVGTLLASGFALAVQPVCAQTMVTTDSGGLAAGEIRIPTSSGEIPGYRAMPDKGGPFPVVLVVQEIFGVHEYIKDVCRRLAKLGYLAIAPELYFRQGDVSQLKEISEILSKVVSKVTDVQLMGDLDAAVAWAKASGKGDTARLGITGFCWGGRVVWMYAAHNPGLKAAVAWYGPVARSYNPESKNTALDIAAEVKAPVLGLYGGADQGIPVDTLEKMREALKAAGKTFDIVVYPDTPHAFHADYRPSYRKGPAEDGWKRLQEWFRKHGVA